MTDDRAQRLRTLLAKVQANAAVHVPGRPRPHGLAAWPTVGEFTSFPDTERPPPPSTEDERAFTAAAMHKLEQEEDRWSSLLVKALDREVLPPPRESGRAAARRFALRKAPVEEDTGNDAAVDRKVETLPAPEPAPADVPETRFLESGVASDASALRLAPPIAEAALETHSPLEPNAPDAREAASRGPLEPAPPEPAAPPPMEPAPPEPADDDEATIPLVAPKLVLIEPRVVEHAVDEPAPATTANASNEPRYDVPETPAEPAPVPSVVQPARAPARARADSEAEASRPSARSARDSSPRDSGRTYSIREEMREREELDFDDASEAPPSALERAIAKAARERALELGAEDAIWGNVIENLRERRSTSPEGLAPLGLSKPAPSSGSGMPRSTRPEDAAQYEPLPRTFIPRIDVPPPPESSARSLSPTSRRIRKRFRAIMPRRGPVPRESRPRWIAWVIAAASVAALAASAAVLVPRWLSKEPSTAATEARRQPSAVATSPSAPTAARTETPPQSSTQAPTARPSAIASSPPPASNGGVPPAPDLDDLPYHTGYVYFVSERPLNVYANGNFAGETNQWLKLECEYRNIRFADRSVPRVGGNFPIWEGEGHTIVVPCGKATTLDSEAR